MTGLIRAVIDRRALRANLQQLRRLAPGRRVMAVVKANAYGHGLVPTALALDGTDAFAVARLGEAGLLREAGVRAPIVLLEGVFDAAQLAEAAQGNFELVVHDPLQIALLAESQLQHRFVVWLKVDTGMNRLGFRPEQFAGALQQLRQLGPKLRELRLLTHLARADERGAAQTSQQLQQFARLVAGRGLVTSIANSAATLACPAAHGDWVRPGLALYGVSPFADETAASLGLRPAMTLRSQVISTREVPVGETVGYGGTWQAHRPTRLAIVAAGYGDGLPRNLMAGTPVLIAGERLPLVGRVSMDMLAVDVTEARMPVRVGTDVVLWGAGLPVETLAACAGTVPYELLCGISQRVPLAFEEAHLDAGQLDDVVVVQPAGG